MKIVHLLKHGQRGNGHVHVAVDLACAQAASGHDVTFAAARSSYTGLMEDHGVRVIDLVEPVSVRQASRSAGQLWRLCRETRPDIVHAHMMSSAAIAFPITKTLGMPLVTTVHNSFDRHSVLMRLGRVVIAVSTAERELLLSRGYAPERVVTIVNGAARSPRDEVADDERVLARPCVMTLSGLHRRKAVDDVVRAFSELAPEFPHWHLNVVGSGPDSERLRSLVTDLGLESSVHLLGATTAPRSLLRSAEIFVSASLREPGGLTVMEARDAGCAIVATAVGGMVETLEYGAAGQLVPPANPPALAQSLRRLMADPSELSDWRERSVRGAEFFAVSRMAEDHVRLYESILAGGPIHRPAGVPVS